VSAEGSVRFGVEHLRYEVARRMKPIPWGWVGTVLGAAVTGVAVHPLVGVGLLVPLWYLLVKHSAHEMKLSEQDFAGLWRRWVDVNGTPPAAIVRKQPEQGPYRSVEVSAEPDLQDYSFDRAVICDRARTVDLLLANNFHFENNCAVLSIHGYPPGAFDVVLAMLKRNPRLRVFALHDATLEGCTMAHLLVTQPAWFPGFKVIDVGLRPGHAGPFLGLYQESTQQVVAQPGVSAEEAAWLSRYTLALAVIRPEQVLKRLYRAIHRQDQEDAQKDARGQAASGADGGGVYIGHRGTYVTDESSFGSDAAAADGGADSFG
jgi:hypothetical protein